MVTRLAILMPFATILMPFVKPKINDDLLQLDVLVCSYYMYICSKEIRYWWGKENAQYQMAQQAFDRFQVYYVKGVISVIHPAYPCSSFCLYFSAIDPMVFYRPRKPRQYVTRE